MKKFAGLIVFAAFLFLLAGCSEASAGRCSKEAGRDIS